MTRLLLSVSTFLLIVLSVHAHALSNSAPTKSSFTCNNGFCQCKGEADCDDMFNSNVCGTVADCNPKTGTCTCFRFARLPSNSKKFDFYKPPVNLK